MRLDHTELSSIVFSITSKFRSGQCKLPSFPDHPTARILTKNVGTRVSTHISTSRVNLTRFMGIHAPLWNSCENAWFQKCLKTATHGNLFNKLRHWQFRAMKRVFPVLPREQKKLSRKWKGHNLWLHHHQTTRFPSTTALALCCLALQSVSVFLLTLIPVFFARRSFFIVFIIIINQRATDESTHHINFLIYIYLKSINFRNFFCMLAYCGQVMWRNCATVHWLCGAT